MGDLEDQEENAPKCVLWYKSMVCLGVIRPHHRDESWSVSLRHTFFSLAVGAQIPSITAMPPSKCAAKNFALDVLGDHVSMVLPIPDPKRHTIGQLSNFLTYFARQIG